MNVARAAEELREHALRKERAEQEASKGGSGADSASRSGSKA